MKGSVYLYFLDELLTSGSFKDLEKLGRTPQEGLSLTFYDLDGDEHYRPTYLCARGTLYFKDGRWHAKVDPKSYYGVMSEDVTPLMTLEPS